MGSSTFRYLKTHAVEGGSASLKVNKNGKEVLALNQDNWQPLMSVFKIFVAMEYVE